MSFLKDHEASDRKVTRATKHGTGGVWASAAPLVTEHNETASQSKPPGARASSSSPPLAELQHERLERLCPREECLDPVDAQGGEHLALPRPGPSRHLVVAVVLDDPLHYRPQDRHLV
jgi:hypothetical protein